LSAERAARSIPLSHSDSSRSDLAPGAIQQEFGVQLLPGAAAGTDGFYYACVEKTTFGT
jgi:hypothetical protein